MRNASHTRSLTTQGFVQQAWLERRELTVPPVPWAWPGQSTVQNPPSPWTYRECQEEELVEEHRVVQGGPRFDGFPDLPGGGGASRQVPGSPPNPLPGTGGAVGQRAFLPTGPAHSCRALQRHRKVQKQPFSCWVSVSRRKPGRWCLGYCLPQMFT